MFEDITLNPQRAAAFAAALVTGLLLLQFAHRRKPFILVWAAGWLLIAPQMLLVARAYHNVFVARTAVGLSQFLDVSSAALFFWSGDLFRQTHIVRGVHARAAGVAVAVFVLTALLFGDYATLVLGHGVSAIVLGAAGTMYGAVLIERRIIGAGLVAFVLFGLAASNMTMAFVAHRMLGGEFVFEIVMANAVLYTFGALGVHQLVFEDMTYELRLTNRRLEAAREELVQAAITDPLTGCHNRRFLEQVMDRELQRHQRFTLPLSLLFIDVNRFKQINDTLGHEAGDRVLRYVARFLKRNIREADYVFRWGGDEFLVLISCTGDKAQRKAAVLKSKFNAAPAAVDLPPGIGLSCGSIEVPLGTTDLMPLVAEADARMYHDKGTR